jgi:hypothetical protein
VFPPQEAAWQIASIFKPLEEDSAATPTAKRKKVSKKSPSPPGIASSSASASNSAQLSAVLAKRVDAGIAKKSST